MAPTFCEVLAGVVEPHEQLGSGCVDLLAKQLLVPPSVCVDALDRCGVGALDRVEARQAQALGEDQSSRLGVDGR